MYVRWLLTEGEICLSATPAAEAWPVLLKVTSVWPLVIGPSLRLETRSTARA